MIRYPLIFAILLGGSIAGAGDIIYAITFSASQGIPPMRLLQVVASGLLGEASFAGGACTAALGFVLHFLMSYLIAAVFYFASLRFHFMTHRPVLSGVLFGLMVFAVMKFIVLPLSAFPYPISFKPLSTITNLLSHMFLFGVPISLVVRRVLMASPLKKNTE